MPRRPLGEYAPLGVRPSPVASRCLTGPFGERLETFLAGALYREFRKIREKQRGGGGNSGGGKHTINPLPKSGFGPPHL